MNVNHVSDELDVIVEYLKAVCEVLSEAGHISRSPLLDLEHLAAQLTLEAQRGAEWLYQAGMRTRHI
jgi:hypothetical protein